MKWKNTEAGMMYCAEAFKSREIWIIYNLMLEECQGFNACSVLQRKKVETVLTEQIKK